MTDRWWRQEQRRLIARQLATLMSINPDVITIDRRDNSIAAYFTDVKATNIHAHRTDGPIDEDAYRRGFQQGFEATVERWRWKIYCWRFMRSHKKRIYPPRFKPPKMKVPRDRR